jgi:predicted nucleic acid-binding protein
MNKIIFDTSFIVGFIDKNDIWHYKASLINNRLLEVPCIPIVFDCVISEAISVLVKRQKEKKKETMLQLLIENLFRYIPRESITWIYPNIEEYFDKSIEIIKQNNSIFNFNDALIIHAANEFEISHIVSFDKGFDKTKLKRIKDARDTL